jgi:hypothetical protein
MNQFSTENFRRIVSDYLHQDELHSLVLEMNEQLSDLNSPSFTDDGRQSSQRLDRHFIHPKDPSKILLVTGACLPHNQSVFLFAATYSQC